MTESCGDGYLIQDFVPGVADYKYVVTRKVGDLHVDFVGYAKSYYDANYLIEQHKIEREHNRTSNEEGCRLKPSLPVSEWETKFDLGDLTICVPKTPKPDMNYSSSSFVPNMSPVDPSLTFSTVTNPVDDMLQRLQVLSPKPGDMIVLTVENPLDPQDRDEIRAALNDAGFDKVGLLVLYKDESIATLSEKEMEEQGWIRKRENRGFEFL